MRALWAARRRLPALVLLPSLVLAGCGVGSSPGESVPALEGSLVRIDDAVTAHDWSSARRQLATLMSETRTAVQAGKLTPQQADTIRQKAAALRARLPR